MKPSSVIKPKSTPRLILASASPRRAALMREHGFDVDVVIPPFDEPQDLSGAVSPRQHAEALSYYKARSVAETIPDGWILGGDTVVVLARRIYGKPADRDDARWILTRLAGTTHEVITGVTILDAATGTRLTRHDVTGVTMRRLTPQELEDYLESGEWSGKAGAYGIQDRADAFVERIEGSFTNVVGFPMELVRRMLEEFPIMIAEGGGVSGR